MTKQTEKSRKLISALFGNPPDAKRRPDTPKRDKRGRSVSKRKKSKSGIQEKKKTHRTSQHKHDQKVKKTAAKKRPKSDTRRSQISISIPESDSESRKRQVSIKCQGACVSLRKDETSLAISTAQTLTARLKFSHSQAITG